MFGEKYRVSGDPGEELLRLNQRLLESIATADWAAYEELCDPSLTAFEPEALGQLVEGLDFHRFNICGTPAPFISCDIVQVWPVRVSPGPRCK